MSYIDGTLFLEENQDMPQTIKELSGPKSIPIVGNLHQLKVDRLHQYFERWAEEYGSVFRVKMGPFPIAVITDPEITQYILRERPDGFIRMKKLDNVLQDDDVHGVFNAEGEDWKLHRKMVAKGLDVKHQKDFYPQMMKTLEILYNKWKKNADNEEIIDIQQDFLRFTVDITTSLAFGYEMNTLEEKGGVVQDHLEKVFPILFKRINQPFPFHKLIKSKKDRSYDKSLVEIKKLISEFIEQGRKRIADNPDLIENPKNFIDAILVAAESEDSFSDREVRGNLLTLLLAGEDTTAHTLAWSIYLLTQNADKQKSIEEEVDEVLGENPWMTEYEMHQKLPFVEAVTNETMRMKPVAPLLIFEPINDVEIKGYRFKKGDRMLVQTRKAATDDQYFSDAKQFMPERWLKASKCPVHNMEAFVPFGGGPRFCPGKNLAILEMKMVLSMLFKNFEIEMITPHEEVEEIMAFTMMASPYKVKIKHRNR